MNVKPVAGPHAIQQPQASGPDGRTRAIEGLKQAMQSNAQPSQAPSNHSPQLNQNAISAEDMGAIIPKPNLQTGQQDAQEVTKPEAQAPKPQQTPEEEARSRRFAQLARQEKDLRTRQEALKQREAALQAKEQEVTQANSKYSSGYYSQDQIKQNALRVLAEAGVDIQSFIQEAVSQPALDPRVQAEMDQLKAQLKRFEDNNEKAAKAQEEAQSAQYQAAVRQIRSDVNSLVTMDPEFELIKTTGSQQDVVELIEATFKEDGTLLSVEDAAKEVEKYLTEQAERLARSKKIQSRLMPSTASQASAQQGPAKTQEQQQPGMKTLTNASASTRPLSARERAIMAFKGQNRA